jgi:hypothetical protein
MKKKLKIIENINNILTIFAKYQTREWLIEIILVNYFNTTEDILNLDILKNKILIKIIMEILNKYKNLN